VRSALALGRRVVVEDVLADPQSGAPPDREALRRAGVHALQSTLADPFGQGGGRRFHPLPSAAALQEHALRWLDLLARQAADLIDCAHTSAELRASESRLRALVSASADIVFRLSANGTQVRILERDGVSSGSTRPASTLAAELRGPR
jgi:GAF domain-containing protein